MKKLIFIFLFFLSNIAQAIDLDEYIDKCKDIGFKPKTSAFGDCVLELRKRDIEANSLASTRPSISSAETSINISGDGSDDDITCGQYGFTLGTEQYNQCRLQLKLAMQQFQSQQALYDQQKHQYQEQLQRYEEQLAAAKKEKERQKGLRLLELGLRMGTGQSMRDASMATAGMMPIMPYEPARPAFENYSVTLPGGKTTHCSYNVATRSMNCY